MAPFITLSGTQDSIRVLSGTTIKGTMLTTTELVMIFSQSITHKPMTLLRLGFFILLNCTQLFKSHYD